MLAIKYGTGKLDHDYIEFYRHHSEPIRTHQLKILEIGVAHGRSVKMWQEYFVNSMIYAVDIVDKKCYEDKRIKIVQG